MQLTCIILLATCLQASAAAHGQKVTIIEKKSIPARGFQGNKKTDGV